jgi:diacylglycerol kinase family enzyme
MVAAKVIANTTTGHVANYLKHLAEDLKKPFSSLLHSVTTNISAAAAAAAAAVAALRTVVQEYYDNLVIVVVFL